MYRRSSRNGCQPPPANKPDCAEHPAQRRSWPAQTPRPQRLDCPNVLAEAASGYKSSRPQRSPRKPRPAGIWAIPAAHS